MERLQRSTGPHELFLSDQPEILETGCLLDKAKVTVFNEHDIDQPWIQRGQFYRRGDIKVMGRGTSSRQGPLLHKYLFSPSFCCVRGYNPEGDRQIYCSKCQQWYHVDHLIQGGWKEEDYGIQRDLDPNLTDLEHAKLLPMVRGEGWLEVIKGLAQFPQEQLDWLSVGSRCLVGGYLPGPLGQSMSKPRAAELIRSMDQQQPQNSSSSSSELFSPQQNPLLLSSSSDQSHHPSPPDERTRSRRLERFNQQSSSSSSSSELFSPHENPFLLSEPPNEQPKNPRLTQDSVRFRGFRHWNSSSSSGSSELFSPHENPFLLSESSDEQSKNPRLTQDSVRFRGFRHWNSSSSSGSSELFSPHENPLPFSESSDETSSVVLEDAFNLPRSKERETLLSEAADNNPRVLSDYEERVPVPFVEQRSVGPTPGENPELWSKIAVVDDLHFHPNLVSNVLANLETLKPGVWIEYSCVEKFMINQRLELPEDQVFTHYVPQMNHTESVTPETITQYCQVYKFDPLRNRKPACTIINPNSTHWWGLYLDRDRDEAYVLGRSTTAGFNENATRDWQSWRGPQIWQRICQLHGWNDDLPFRVFQLDWNQYGGNDCGAHIVGVLQAIVRKGFAVSPMSIHVLPEVPCIHQTRLAMLEKLFGVCIHSLQKYRAVAVRDPQALDGNEVQALLTVIEENYLDDRLPGGVHTQTAEYYRGTLRELKRAMISCVQCKAKKISNKTKPHTESLHQPSPLPPPPPQYLTANPFSESDPVVEGVPPAAPGSPLPCKQSQRPPSENWSTGEKPTAKGVILEADSPGLPSKLPLLLPPLYETARAISKKYPELEGLFPAGHVPRLTSKSSAKLPLQSKVEDPSVPRRFPRPFPAPNLSPVYRRPLLMGLDDKFDDYEGGPTLEAIAKLPVEYDGFNDAGLIYHINNPTINPLGIWESWQDRGWRLLPGFCQAFDMQTPTPEFLRQHLIPPLGPFSPPQKFLDPELDDNVKMVSLTELRDMVASDPLIAVKGIQPRPWPLGGRQIKVDLEVDAHQPKHLFYVVDIDCFVHICLNPPFVLSVACHITPVHRKTSPLVSHNHTYVTILVPRAPGGEPRTDYYAKKFKLSQIPHLELARLPRGGQLLLFFPRMIHKDPYSNYWRTNVAFEVKTYFYEKVFYPALAAVKPEWDHQYSVQSMETWLHQNGKGQTPKGVEISPEEFQLLTKRMRLLIKQDKEDPGELQRFGSFFFALTLKGTKDFTKTAVDRRDTVGEAISKSFGKFQNELPYVDFDLMDRQHGCESYVDLGVTVTPPSDPPLVGLLRLPHLEASFGAGGYNMGKSHRLATLDGYGALQAEAGVEHERQSHVAHSSAYSVFYQQFRKADNSVDWFSLSDVANNTPKFVADYQHLEEVLSMDSDKKVSYGVRREFRVGVDAIYVMASEEMNVLDIEAFVDQITWISRPSWYKFLFDRAYGIKHIQQQLFRRQPRPPNYIIISGLLSYLFQALNSTPVIVPSFVRDALSVLQYGTVIATCGNHLGVRG
ncbi:hypothetical protein F5876DRAFT_83622 [Lentinula aff. lateritia]|uniref:Uncharacterized protein n=1 Tax=Lentinula aff. lateritia TaxID=2804960 RepID=A0ACC1THH8_9AGAR|nr:hypothetical protein F5876DRAFT_83622 [Lentinula aff. lateritia]